MANKKENPETEVKEVPEVPTPKKVAPAKEAGYIAFADFVLGDVEYKQGERVILPAGWYPDPSFDEFRQVEKRKGEAIGLAFYKEGEIIDKQTKERQILREILPLAKAA